MKNKKMSLDDVLANATDVQTFKKAEAEATKKRIGAQIIDTENRDDEVLKERKKIEAEDIKKVGRPKLLKSEQSKKRVLYYTDAQFEKIERVANLYDMKATEFIKFCVKKELKKENIEL